MKRIALYATGGVVVVAFSVLMIASHLTYRSAQRFFADFTHLKIGFSPAQDADALTRRFGGTNDCGGAAESCSYWVSFENTWLARLRLAPRTRLYCEVFVRDGRVSGRHFDYTLWDSSQDVILWEPPRGRENPPSPIDVGGIVAGSSPQGELRRIHINIGENAWRPAPYRLLRKLVMLAENRRL